ncbi:MAG: hypothetical protein H7841_17375 [Magnetospirillum sp. WYHS-4]
MTTITKFYFGFPSHFGDPLDALSDAAAVLQMLDSFFAHCEDLNGFERSELNSSMHGLSVVLASATHAINVASDELRTPWFQHEKGIAGSARIRDALDQAADLKTAQEEFAAELAEAVREGRATEPPATDEAGDGVDGATYPRVMTARETVQAARETAIAAAAAKGHTVEEICQAVNMNKANVERILARLRDTGESPADPQPRAVNA